MKRQLGFIILFLFLCPPVWSHEIHEAAERGDINRVKQLLDKNPALVNAKMETKKDYPLTPLHYAVYKDHLDAAALLISRRADPNAINKFGATPLHTAALGTWTWLSC